MTTKKSFIKSDMLEKLIELTESLDREDRIENHLANIIIHQQLAEILLKSLIMRSDLLINLGLSHQKKTRKTKQELDKLMFGQLIKTLAEGVNFPLRTKFIDIARSINKIRIKAVHKLFGITDITELKKLAIQMHKKSNELYSQWYSATAWHDKTSKRLDNERS